MRIAFALLVGSVALSPTVRGAEASAAAPQVSRFDRERLRECSGLVASPAHPGVFWSLSDSGDKSRIFALDAVGKILREVQVEGARNVDWEDIAADDAGFLYIADSGNNRNTRRNLGVYRVAEPDPARGPEAVPVDAHIAFRYPDQLAYPQPGALNFDAEALFWARGRLYLLTKHRSDTRTTLYRFPDTSGAREVVLEPVRTFDVGEGDLPFGGMVTGAAVTPDGRYLAALTYRQILVFERPADSDDYLARPLKRIDLEPLAVKQCEGLAWDSGALLLTNEHGEIHRLAAPLDARCVRYPGCEGTPR